MNLIPFKTEDHDALETFLKRTPAYGDVDQFVSVYNNDMLNKSNPSIQEVAERIANTYRNIELKNRKFVIYTAAEVNISVLDAFVASIKPVLAIRRIANEMIEAGYPEDTKLIFVDNKPGIIHTEVISDDGETIKLVVFGTGEKVVKSSQELAENMFLKPYIGDYFTGNDEEDTANVKCAISMTIAGFEDSFVEEITNIIQRRLKQG